METTSQIITEVKKVIVGKDEVVKKILMAILSSGHVLLEDVPGVGKTTLAMAFSRVLDLEYRRVQFTSDTMASDITGFSLYNKQSGALEYQRGAAFCNLLLADEINRTSPKTQAALLEVMEEKRVTVDGVTRPLPTPFICIATQNPTGSAGTQNLPESQLDRFMVRLSLGYPNLDNQVEIIKSRQCGDPLHQTTQVISRAELMSLCQTAMQVTVKDELIRYAALLAEATRNHSGVARGVSPRAVLALIQMAKAQAFLCDRSYVIPEDIRAVFIDVCCHRLQLNAQSRVAKLQPEEILAEVIATVSAPALI